ncbi:MAG: alpha/beta hydrolase [Caulobacteraceae bacterium]
MTRWRRRLAAHRLHGRWTRALWIGAGAALALAAPASAASPIFKGPLYGHPAEGSETWREPRVVTECNGEVSIFNTHEPQIEVFLPDRTTAGAPAVVLLPGGGLRVLGVGAESDAEVEAFLRHGVAVLRLEYRTAQTPAQAIPRACRPRPANAPPVKFPKLEIRKGNANPAPGDEALARVLAFAVADAQESLRLAHRKAGEWGLDPRRIGMIGTSAGGGVAFGAILAKAPPEAKPAFLVSIFGPSLQDVAVPPDAPPLLLVTEADHGPVTDGLLAVFSLWKDAGRPAELHVYDVPTFSMTVDLWGPRMFDWLKQRGVLAAAP